MYLGDEGSFSLVIYVNIRNFFFLFNFEIFV